MKVPQLLPKMSYKVSLICPLLGFRVQKWGVFDHFYYQNSHFSVKKVVEKEPKSVPFYVHYVPFIRKMGLKSVPLLGKMGLGFQVVKSKEYQLLEQF